MENIICTLFGFCIFFGFAAARIVYLDNKDKSENI